jgi:hypothetical protein
MAFARTAASQLRHGWLHAIGAPDYQAYLAHHAQRHPGTSSSSGGTIGAVPLLLLGSRDERSRREIIAETDCKLHDALKALRPKIRQQPRKYALN